MVCIDRSARYIPVFRQRIWCFKRDFVSFGCRFLCFLSFNICMRAVASYPSILLGLDPSLPLTKPKASADRQRFLIKLLEAGEKDRLNYQLLEGSFPASINTYTSLAVQSLSYAHIFISFPVFYTILCPVLIYFQCPCSLSLMTLVLRFLRHKPRCALLEYIGYCFGALEHWSGVWRGTTLPSLIYDGV